MIRRILLGIFLLSTNALAGLTRGPYLQMPDTNGVTIIWHSEHADVYSVVEFGFEPQCTDGSLTTTVHSVERVVRIPSLLPGTNYFYKVDGEIHTLRTRALPDQPIEFAVIGSFGYPSGAAARIARQVNTQDLDLLLTVGDNIYPKGEAKNYDARWFFPYSSTLCRTPCFPTLGAQDVMENGGQAFLDDFRVPTNGPPGLIGRNYSYDYGPAHFIAIDTDPFENDQTTNVEKIIEWAAHDLAATKQPWKFAYFNRPAYTSVGKYDESQSVKTNLMPVLEAAGVQMVFTGANHFYERLKPIHGIVEIVTGGGGQPLDSAGKRSHESIVLFNKLHSFALIKIDGQHLRLQAIDEEGRIVDDYSFTRSSKK